MGQGQHWQTLSCSSHLSQQLRLTRGLWLITSSLTERATGGFWFLLKWVCRDWTHVQATMQLFQVVCLSLCLALTTLSLSTAGAYKIWGELDCVPWIAIAMVSLPVPPAASRSHHHEKDPHSCSLRTPLTSLGTKVIPWEGRTWRPICSTPETLVWIRLRINDISVMIKTGSNLKGFFSWL